MDREFVVGDRVMVKSSSGRIHAISVVEKITHGGKRVVLKNGDEWKQGGWYRWGSSRERFYTGPSLHYYTDVDVITYRKQNAVSKICATRGDEWFRAKVEDLEAIVAIIDAVNKSTKDGV